eukprot:GHVU01203302.1.p2 GENE.GHVU01203302.1~~GHVU01203302.1.p2  ORF type:complete len:203 (-),score=16.94 GHVU01203302.1:581-1189(-)
MFVCACVCTAPDDNAALVNLNPDDSSDNDASEADDVAMVEVQSDTDFDDNAVHDRRDTHIVHPAPLREYVDPRKYKCTCGEFWRTRMCWHIVLQQALNSERDLGECNARMCMCMCVYVCVCAYVRVSVRWCVWACVCACTSVYVVVRTWILYVYGVHVILDALIAGVNLCVSWFSDMDAAALPRKRRSGRQSSALGCYSRQP